MSSFRSGHSERGHRDGEADVRVGVSVMAVGDQLAAFTLVSHVRPTSPEGIAIH